MIDKQRLQEIADWVKSEDEQASRDAKDSAMAYCNNPDVEENRWDAQKFNAVTIAYRKVWEALRDLLEETSVDGAEG